jgi:cardiolipin synthase
LFLIFGVNRVERRVARKQAATQEIAGRLDDPLRCTAPADELPVPVQQRLARLAERVAHAPVLRGNSVELLVDTNLTLRRIEEAILQAQRSIHLEYYIWQPDRTGGRLRDMLIERARAGVAVRFLYDQLGSMRLTRKFLQPMRDAGIQVRSFLPGTSLRERWSLNLRSHRKIVVVDGRLGFTGGMNIGDEYLGRNPELGYWRDTHLQLVGPCVRSLQQVFAEDWYYAASEVLLQPELFPEPVDAGPHLAQVVHGGPDGDDRPLHALFFAAINEARERITLATSYFVPTEPLAAALESAGVRGVRVRLLVAGKSAHPLTIHAGRSYYDQLLDAGVEILEYKRGILHSKMLTVDGCWSFVGTPNFDARSLLLNFETGVALFNPEIARELESHFDRDAEHARMIRPADWRRRSTGKKMLQNVCRLLAPVL